MRRIVRICAFRINAMTHSQWTRSRICVTLRWKLFWQDNSDDLNTTVYATAEKNKQTKNKKKKKNKQKKKKKKKKNTQKKKQQQKNKTKKKTTKKT